jgi:hypothetical protein
LNLELAIDPGFGLFEYLVRYVAGDDLDAPSDYPARHLLQTHHQRVRLLTTGRGGTPDAQAALAGARREQRGYQSVPEMLERHLVPEKKRFVGHHGFDDVGAQCPGARALQDLHKF